MIECHPHMLIKQFYQSLKKPRGWHDAVESRRAVRLLTRASVHTSGYLCQYYASISSRDKRRRARFHSRTRPHFVPVSGTRHIKAGIRERDLACGSGKNSATVFLLGVCLRSGGRWRVSDYSALRALGGRSSPGGWCGRVKSEEERSAKDRSGI